MKEKVLAFDLSQVEILRAKGPDGTVWAFPDVPDMNFVQTSMFQQFGFANMAMMKATQEGRDDVKDFLLIMGQASINLLSQLVTNEETGDPPTEAEASDLSNAGFSKQLLLINQKATDADELEREGRKTGESMFDALNLDEFKKGGSRPTPEGSSVGDTPSGSSDSGGSTAEV